MENQFPVLLKRAIADFGIEPLTDEQLSKLEKHYAMLRKWNARINLTRIIEPREAAMLHYAESLFAAQFIDDECSVLDIGSGAGFPAIPLAVARADVHVTALEANQKKSLFLKEVKDELALKNFGVATARLEEIDGSGYDLLTTRAVDRLGNVVPSIIESLGPNQRLMIFSTPQGVDDLNLSSELIACRYAIPYAEERLLVVLARK